MSTHLVTAPPSAGLTQPSRPSSPLSITSTGVETTPSVEEEPSRGMQPVPGSHRHLLACLLHLHPILTLWIPLSHSTTPITTLSPSLRGKSSQLTSCSIWVMSLATQGPCPGCPRTSNISTTKPWLPLIRTPTHRPSPGRPKTGVRRGNRNDFSCPRTIWRRGWGPAGWGSWIPTPTHQEVSSPHCPASRKLSPSRTSVPHPPSTDTT